MNDMVTRIRHPARFALQHVVFFTGLAAWLIVHALLVGIPFSTRHVPPETDDAYGYLNKAAQMETCFWQECPALQDLRIQLHAPTRDPEVGFQRIRAHVRNLLVYTPLYSAVLVGLHQVGLSWEAAYQLVCYLAIPFFGLVFAFWLRSMWGLAPAGIAMGMLAPQVFSDQGLHFVVPSNLALGIAALMWSRVITRRGDAPWTLVLGTVVLVTLHPIGRAYAIITLLISIILAGFPRTRNAWLPPVLTVLLVGIASALPFIVHQPDLAIRPYPYPEGHTWITELQLTQARGTKNSLKMIQTLTVNNVFIGTLLLCGAIVVGYRTLPPARRAELLTITLLFGAVVTASLFVVRPHYPASLFERISIPLIILLVGAAARAIWAGIVHAGTLLHLQQSGQQQPVQQPGQGEQKHDRYEHATLTRAHLVLVVVIVPLLFIHTMLAARPLWLAEIENMISDQDIALEPAQVEVLHTYADAGHRVLYIHETLRDFYLTHGATRYGAVFQPALANSPQAAAWFQRPDLRFAVLWNPPGAFLIDKNNLDLHGMVTPEGVISLESVTWMQLEARRAPDTASLKIQVHNHGAASGMHLVPLVNGEYQHDTVLRQEIPANWSGWLTFDISQEPRATTWDIGFAHESPQLSVSSIVFDCFDDDHSPLRWPWEHKAILRMTTRSNQTLAFDFDPAHSLPPPLAGRQLSVLDDRGASVLVRIASPKGVMGGAVP